jgi:dihydrofolate reductase
VWVIGGAQIYAQALAQAQRVEVTEIQQPFEGDAFAPTLDASWHAVARSPQHVSAQGLPYAFVSYRRAPQQG